MSVLSLSYRGQAPKLAARDKKTKKLSIDYERKKNMSEVYLLIAESTHTHVCAFVDKHADQFIVMWDQYCPFEGKLINI